MRCPSCNSLDTQVKDSRPTEDSAVIRRRRVCITCNFRFTTFERVQLRELTVIKRNGRRVPFDRDKLARSVQVALRKRPVENERVEKLINDIVRKLESSSEAEISSHDIGELAMEALKGLDGVAYVRFASVYRHFQDVEAFHEEIQRLRSQRAASETLRDNKRAGKREPGREANRDQLPLLPADTSATGSGRK